MRGIAVKILGTIGALVLFLFVCIQFSCVQKVVLGYFCDAEFSRISGVIPFNFCVHDFKIKNNKTEVLAKKIEVTCNNIKTIKNVTIDGLYINNVSSKKSKIDFVNIEKIINAQFLINSIVINDVKYNAFALKSVQISNCDKYIGRKIKILLNNDIINCEIMKNDKKIFTNVNYKAWSLCTKYDGAKIVDCVISADNKKVADIKIIDCGNSAKCEIKHVKYKNPCQIVLRRIGDVLKFDCHAKLFANIDLNAEYDIHNVILSVNCFNVGTILSVQPFCSKNSKIINVNILGGNITVHNLDMVNGGFGRIDISRVNLAKADIGVQGIIDGCCTKKRTNIIADITISKFKYNWIFSKYVKCNVQYSANALECCISHNCFNIAGKIDAKINCVNWIANSNCKLIASTKNYIPLELMNNKKHIFKGRIYYELNVMGSLENPIITGDIYGKNIVYANAITGMCLKNGDIKAVIKNNMLEIIKCDFTDDAVKNGVATCRGSIKSVDDMYLVNVGVNTNRLHVIKSRDFKCSINSDIKITGDTKKLKIGGNIVVNNPKFDITNYIKTLMYTISNTDKNKQQESKTESIFSIPVDVSITAKPHLCITGFGISSIWSGDVKVTGTLDNLKYKSTLVLDKGKIVITNKSFQLKHGAIKLEKNLVSNVSVDLSAIKVVNDIKIRIRFVQTNNKSDVYFYSTPYLAKQDILSYMLFEKPSAEISIGETLTLLSIMNNLSGKTSAFAIIDQIKTVFGLDTLELKQHKDEELGEYNAFRISKKIGKMIVAIERGAEKGTERANVSIPLSKHITAGISHSSENTISIEALFNYSY